MNGVRHGSLVEVPRGHRKGEERANKRSYIADYFSIESLLVLFCLTASLLVLPLILPPLPPPPLLLLLLPIGILAVLMILAVMPAHITNVVVSSV